MNVTIIRRPEVCRLTGLSYSTIYRLERAGRFPQRRRLGEHSVGWLRDEVETWIGERSAVAAAPATANAQG